MKTITLVCAAAAAAAVFSGGPATAQAAYSPGDHVEVYSPMSGKWEKAVIQRLDGTMADGQQRYFIHADDPTLSNAYWGTTGERVRPSPNQGAGAPPAGPPQAARPGGGANTAPAGPAGDFPPNLPPPQ